MSNSGPFYPATHSPNDVRWRPVVKRTTIHTPEGPVVAEAGQHIEIEEEDGSKAWVNGPEDFWRRYGKSLRGKALEVFKQHFPGIAKNEQ